MGGDSTPMPTFSQAQANTPDPLALTLRAAVGRPGAWAWRVYSQRLGRELWIARDADMVRALEQDGARAGLPVVLNDDFERLETLDDRRLHQVLDALASSPGARLADL